MATDDLIALFREQAQTLPDWLRGHVGRVVSEATRLATIHELDVPRIQAAAWGHDLYRAHTDEALLRAARQFGLEAGFEERLAPILLHGPIAAREAEAEWGVDDDEVLEAIRWHTTGHPHMSDVALAVFVADKLEPEKVAADPGLAPIRTLAREDLREAMALLLERRLAQLVGTPSPIHPVSVQARNYYLALGDDGALGGDRALGDDGVPPADEPLSQ